MKNLTKRRSLTFLSYRLFPLLLAVTLTACSTSKKNERANEPNLVYRGPVANPEEAKKAFIAGNLLLDRRDWQGARSRFKESISLDPEPWETYMNAAISEIMNAESLKAIDLMKECFEHGGDTKQVAYYNLGNIYQERGLYYEAAQTYRAGLAVGNPNDIDSLTNLAASYLFMGDNDSAEATYTYLQTLEPNSPVPLQGLGMVYYAREDYAKALKTYEEVNARMPDFAPGFFNKGEILLLMDRKGPAKEAFATYLQLAPSGPYAGRAQNRIDAITAASKNY